MGEIIAWMEASGHSSLLQHFLIIGQMTAAWRMGGVSRVMVNLLKALLVGTMALAVAIAMIFGLVWLFGEEMQTSMWVSAVLGCYGIGSTVSGYLFLQSDRYRAALAELAETHGRLAAAHGRIADNATFDAMTGMLNRGAFMEALRRSSERRLDGSLMIVDVDRFRSVNDTYGQHEGDAALMVIAGLIRKAARPNDILGRLDGAEFGLFLPGCGHVGSHTIAERIRTSINTFPFQPVGRGRVSLSVSIGIETMPESWTPHAAIRVADSRLEDAKIRGRNRVATATAA